MPGTGHRIVGPDDLVELKPDVVIVMNPDLHAKRSRPTWRSWA